MVDENNANRELVTSILRADGYHVLAARDAREAYALLENPNQALDVLITDAIGPGLEGLDLACRIAKTRPSLKTILMSSWMGSFIEGLLAVQTDNFEVISKPIMRDTLLGTVDRLLMPYEA